MSEYLLSVIGTVLLSALLTAIAPEGKTSAIIKGVAKLACVVAIVAPIPHFLQAVDSDENNDNSQIFFKETVIQTDENFIKYYSEMRIRATAQQLEEEIFKEFALEAEVTLEWRYDGEEEIVDTENILITKMYVQIQQPISEEEKKTMWEYLTKNYCSEVLLE